MVHCLAFEIRLRQRRGRRVQRQVERGPLEGRMRTEMRVVQKGLVVMGKLGQDILMA